MAIVTAQQLEDASIDCETVEQAVNGADNEDVTSRLGAVYPTIPKALRLIVENGLLGATPYRTKALLDAANIAEGAYAIVTDDQTLDNNGFKYLNGFWQKKSGVLVYLAWNPNAAITKLLGTIKLNFYHDDSGNRYIFALVDNNKVGFGITSKLKIVWGDHQLLLDKIGGFRDKIGQYAIAVRESGNVYIPNLQLSEYALAQIPKSSFGTKVVYAMPADPDHVYHIVGYGQSLSIGATASPALSTSQPYSNIMFSSGTAYSYDQGGSYNATSFAPLIEQYMPLLSGVQAHAETPTSGALNGFSKRCVDMGLTAANYVMLGTQAGVGGQSIDALSSTHYMRLSTHIKDAKALSKIEDKTYSVSAITWYQGEADISAPIAYSAYLQKLNAIADKIQKTAIDASEQSSEPILFTYQSTSLSTSSANIVGVATAQWQVSVQRPDVVMTNPVYHLPHSTGDVHLTNEGSWLMGQYTARAMHWTFILGKKWRPLEPVIVEWFADHIDIQYHVPCKPIQLSTLLVGLVENYGFSIWNQNSLSARGDDAKIVNAISAVEVVSEDTIRLTLNTGITIPSGAALRYCEPGDGSLVARGNVLDSHGLYDTVTSPSNTTYPLYNAGVFFQFDRRYGFSAI